MVAPWLGVPAFGLTTSIIGNTSVSCDVVSVKAIKDPCDHTGGPGLKAPPFVLLHMVSCKFSCERVLGPRGAEHY